jgi:quinol-cytochrome oxidoreductase complex cytochrome b subunit
MVGRGSSVRGVTGWDLATKALQRAATVCLAVLVVTGIPLLWLYRPPLSQEWVELIGLEQSWWDRVQDDWLREIHYLASLLLVPLVVGGLVVAFLRRSIAPARAVASQIGVGAVGLAVAVVGGVTGLLVAWDQLGLEAVTVGDSYRGALAATRSDVRFVIVDGAEVSPGTYLGMLAVHTLAVPVLGIAAVVLLRRWRPGDRHVAQPKQSTSQGTEDTSLSR